MDSEPLKYLSSTSQIPRRPGSGEPGNVFVLLDSRLTKITVSVYLMGSQVTNLPPFLPSDGSPARLCAIMWGVERPVLVCPASSLSPLLLIRVC